MRVLREAAVWLLPALATALVLPNEDFSNGVLPSTRGSPSTGTDAILDYRMTCLHPILHVLILLQSLKMASSSSMSLVQDVPRKSGRPLRKLCVHCKQIRSMFDWQLTSPEGVRFQCLEEPTSSMLR